MSVSQNPTSCRADLRKVATAPDTVKTRPYTRCARLIMPIIEENSPTWTLPSKVERLRILGLPVTAPTLGLVAKCQTIHCTAQGSSTTSPSIQTRNSFLAERAARVSPLALPWLVARWTTRKRRTSLERLSSISPVSSLLPSLMAIISKSGYLIFCNQLMVSMILAPSL